MAIGMNDMETIAKPNSNKREAWVITTLSLVVVIASCSKVRGKGDVTIDGVLIPQADGNYILNDVPEAPTVTLEVGQASNEIQLPEGPAVRLAIARDVSYGSAKALIERVEAAGKMPIILVGERFRLRAIHLNDKLSHPGNAIRLVATPNGQACVAPPDNPKSKCVQGVYSRHISTAFVREFVREAINGYGLDEVRVYARPSVEFADVIRAIDGARTCCDGKITPLVRLADADNDTAFDAAGANMGAGAANTNAGANTDAGAANTNAGAANAGAGANTSAGAASAGAGANTNAGAGANTSAGAANGSNAM